MTDALPPDGAVLDADELAARWADARRPEQVAARLDGAGTPWCVVAGWALKDHTDFDGVLPLLSRTRREALGGWLTRVHPGHPWLAGLAGR
ncbi:hypothetical protein ACFXDH_19505 [Streptomyces sp. NPDC059467]|uniref:hypothetical protein n=1 Tax=Streptomyces sp. NPDC059467 TaxID=3346844 RepID=UPI0036C39F1E